MLMEEEKKKEYLSISIEEHMDMYMKKGVDKKEAMKLAAKDRGVSKRGDIQQFNKMMGNQTWECRT